IRHVLRETILLRRLRRRLRPHHRRRRRREVARRRPNGTRLVLVGGAVGVDVRRPVRDWSVRTPRRVVVFLRLARRQRAVRVGLEHLVVVVIVHGPAHRAATSRQRARRSLGRLVGNNLEEHGRQQRLLVYARNGRDRSTILLSWPG
ncbi:MAG: hypothetical protein ACK56I_03255, partial [bacterium]